MILAFDTATDRLTIAIGTAANIVAKTQMAAPRAHLNRLLPEIDNMLKKIGIPLSEIDHFAVGIGPGSFTGVRIGTAVAQGLAHALNRPLVGISTLDVVAAALVGHINDIDIYPILAAGRREIYTAGYDHLGTRFTDYQVLSPEQLAGNLTDTGKSVLLAGDGLADYSTIFTDKLGRSAHQAKPSCRSPSASVLIRLAEEKIDRREVEPYFKVLPIYIRLPDAEEAVLKREKLSQKKL